MLKQALAENALWAVFGAAAWFIFYTRFYVQWLTSEAKGRSVVPPVFWYQSAVGSLMLLVWAWHVQSPLGALSQSVNLIPYSRNLIHIWREKGRLTPLLNAGTHVLVAIAVVAAAVVVFVTWGRAVRTESARDWMWLAVGVVGQALFALRVLVQWVITERRRKSVVPPVFWHISIVAASLQIVTFVARGGGEWLYALGLLATTVIYARNIRLIHRERAREPAEESS